MQQLTQEQEQAALEARRAYQREYRAKNPEKQREYMRDWRARNKDKVRAYNAAYWARKAQQGA